VSALYLPDGTGRARHGHIKVVGLLLPKRTFISSFGHCLLIPHVGNMGWLSVVIGNDLIRLWWKALILCVVLVNLGLCILWDCCLVG
jgi:hypothetical protein